MKNGLWTLLTQPYAGEDFFLPDLCSPRAVFTLVVLAELVVLVWVLAQPVAGAFNWVGLAMASLFVQWIVLLSAASLCRLRGWMQRQPLLLAILACHLVVIGLTLVFSVLADWILLRGMLGSPQLPGELLLRHGLIALIMTSLLLRYFYLQQQWQRHSQAEVRARLEALQARIRPHFLFNSLNGILSLIGSNPHKAEDALLDLADLFRASLGEVDGLVDWAEERRLCEGYLRIEQARLGTRLRIEWAVELPEQLPILSLSLQPLLENAVLHGVQPDIRGGDIRISGCVQRSQVQIEVSNSCPERSGPTDQGLHMALDNIRARLQARYGAAGQLHNGREGERYFSRLVYPCEQTPVPLRRS
ncbi:MAG: sensor histidine kinase [Halopseudomonas yangmingensis]